jgi:hypothetical protein
MQNYPPRGTNLSSVTQENTNLPFIWKQRARYYVYTIPKLGLILSHMNLLHAFPSHLRYLHFYAAICQAVYAEQLIMFTNAMLGADISKICKQS